MIFYCIKPRFDKQASEVDFVELSLLKIPSLFIHKGLRTIANSRGTTLI